MDLLKSAIYILVVMLCVDAVSEMASAAGMGDRGTTLSADTQEALYANDLVSGWAGNDNPFYDIATGLFTWWFKTIPFIESLPNTMKLWGAPSFIYIPLHTVWRFIWLGATALGIIAGRRT